MRIRKNGFTLIELLVVIAIIALLMGILMPSLARVRVIANRMVCGSRLADIGKGMLMYAEENQHYYPQGGLRNGLWASTGFISQWDATTRDQAFGGAGTAAAGGAGAAATITSSFYLLIKYGNQSTRQFVCPDDADAKEFHLSDYQTSIKELTSAWDFGDNPGVCCSYSYNMPYPNSDDHTKKYSLDSSSSPGSPLCADRNPYLDKNAREYLKNPKLQNPSLSQTDGAYRDDDLKGNTAAHERKAQNVLYNDGHVSAEPYPNVGINNDNIWKFWSSANPTNEEREVGSSADIFANTPAQGTAKPQNKDDSCLVSERNDNKE